MEIKKHTIKFKLKWTQLHFSTYKFIKKYGMNWDIHLLKWVASDSNFKPARYDKGLKKKRGKLRELQLGAC